MLPRLLTPNLADALERAPAVMIVGARQTGKSTLAESVAKGDDWSHVTLDDSVSLGFALKAPKEFLAAYPGKLFIDEIQRAPGLMPALKAAVDKNRTPGRFLLTGSANVLTLPKVSESLAGRMEVLDLFPLTQSELEGTLVNPLDALFQEEWQPPRFLPAPNAAARIVRGGFPEPSQRRAPAGRRAWHESYLRTLLERDVRDLAQIDRLTDLPQLLRALAAQAGMPLNVDSLSRDTGIAATTLRRYLDLFEKLFLTQTVPAWSANPSVRLAKTPKVYLADSGMHCHIAGVTEKAMATDDATFKTMLERFVATELVRLANLSEGKPRLNHLRTVRQLAVDFLLEDANQRLIGIDVSTYTSAEPHLGERIFALPELTQGRFLRGIVLYQGTTTVPLGPNIWAVPLSWLWDSAA